SKKIVLSLATISFLASCANATLTPEIKTYDEANKNTKARSASVYAPQARINTTVSSSETSTINITDQGPHTIIIQSNGTLGSIGNTDRIIYAHASGSNILTLTNLTNKGTINGKVAVEHDNNFKGTITVNTFENTGQINGQIYMGIWGGNSGTLTVDKFENSGTIVGSNDRGVLFEGKNTNIQSFVNSGLISGSEGVTMVGGTIENFINNGTMNGGSSAVFIHNSIIKTLENKGTINSTEDIWWGGAIKLENGGTIENIINTGTINSVVSGIHVSYGKFGTLTIKDGGVVYGKTAGIWVNQWQTLGDLYIDGGKNTSKDGTVSGIYSDNHGIALDVGSSTSKIELKNGGIIQGKVNGIRLEKAASLSGEIILSGEGSRVEGGSGAGISNESGKIEGSIKVEDGATVTSSSGQAISNSGSGSITGGITVSGENTKLEGNIVNTDSASIGSDIKIEGGAKVEGGLVNEGEGSITGSITIDKNSQLDSITNTSNSNTGISGSITNNSDNKLEISNGEGATIGGGITNNGNADLVISNQGSVGKDDHGNTVTNNGSGSVGIKDWVVSTDKNTGKLDTVVVGGSGANNVQVENITVDQSNVNLEELGNISNIISGVNQNNIGNIGTNGGGEISLSFD
ncbi:beta strand repeat-containing protein, partial [Campylobacter jejuni]|uniref:beta strand repeat-containing protein n=2 Tax=Campylobacter TaxID=194 RepID=UPI000AC2E701